MDVIFYLSGIREKLPRFKETVISSIPAERSKLCNSLKELSVTLRRAMAGRSICVIAAAKKKDLFDLLSIQDLLKNSKLVLLLPDDSEETLEVAHLLYPRYLDSIESDYTNLRAVLFKMINFQTIDCQALR